MNCYGWIKTYKWYSTKTKFKVVNVIKERRFKEKKQVLLFNEKINASILKLFKKV